jgi:retron-type reverse transcriptase
VTWERFLRGKRNKKDVIIFQSKLSDNIVDLYNCLQTRTYTHGEYTAFNISDPKPRNIHKATVRDRLLHHLIYKELYMYFDDRFIYDSYSCRKEKGTHRALDRFRCFARKVSKNNTRTCYILKGDIKKFFASIDHEILKSILERHIEDKEILWLLNQVIDSFHTFTSPTLSRSDGKGLPLGNLTSQLLVNIYMHEFDMFIKQEIRVRYYIRYADDFAIFSDHKEYLEELLSKMEKFLGEKLKLKLHENKVYIKTYSSGVDFLGWVHFPYHRQIRTTTKRKIIKKLKGYPKPQTISSYRGLLNHGDTYKQRKSLGLA